MVILNIQRRSIVCKMAMFLFSFMIAIAPIAQAETTKCVVIKGGGLCCWNPEEDGYYIPLACL